MKKLSLALIFLLTAHFLSGQGFKPVTDCKDLKDKILSIQKTYNNLAGYKEAEIKKEGSTTFYSSKFSLCGNKSVIEDRSGDITLKLEFNSTDYEGNIHDISISGQKVLTIIKEVFGKWKFEETRKNDDESNSTIYIFYESGNSDWEAKNYIKVHSFSMDDYRAFSIEFVHKN
jgi:hypothetical protein